MQVGTTDSLTPSDIWQTNRSVYKPSTHSPLFPSKFFQKTFLKGLPILNTKKLGGLLGEYIWMLPQSWPYLCTSCSFQNENPGNILGGPVVRTLLSLSRIQVQSLVGELNPTNPVAEKKKKERERERERPLFDKKQGFFALGYNISSVQLLSHIRLFVTP